MSLRFVLALLSVWVWVWVVVVGRAETLRVIFASFGKTVEERFDVAVREGIDFVPAGRKGEIDTILSVQVLCGVPGPERICKAMYELLKPGGTMIVYEHVEARDRASRFMQGWSKPHLLRPFSA